MEAAAEQDDALMEKYLEEGTLSDEDIKKIYKNSVEIAFASDDVKHELLKQI